ncbi:hypothetical protein FHS55_004563 [Angulomicrobium tetraedrale]|uniref:Uncharacterized protein n=1 Tax=Ancylobacter tetraedralis TaxID=217068 RepID=A0A839ZH67_9HYPH|nr:Arm DNA-binding domain-containing protein [Ancylobacter tetraedralis]MBB3773917.1 hypothetical protein [Ancylobacter tetraedralis]
MLLTDVQIRRAKPGERALKLTDGGGLSSTPPNTPPAGSHSGAFG